MSAGEFFLRQLENEVAFCETPLQQTVRARPGAPIAASSSTPLALPSLRKLRFRQGNTPAKPAEEAKAIKVDDECREDGSPVLQDDDDDDDDEDNWNDDGFIIHCSQNYERCRDYPGEDLEATPEDASQRVREREVGGGEDCGHQLQQQGGADRTPEISRTRPIECSLPSSSSCQALDLGNLTGSAVKTPCYSIFRGASDRKTVHIIRHGESVYNAIDRYSRSLEDPFVFDAPLTDLGRQQAKALRDKLSAKLGGAAEGEVLWVTSPLTRCIQTMLTAYGQVFRKELNGGGAPSSLPAIKVCSHMAEHLATTGDVGRPRSLLVKDFPKMREALDDLEERWWWQPSKNDAISMKFDSREPKKNLQKRVGLFRQWVLRQPHRVIVAFGHSTFWKEFSGSTERLRNCEVDTIYV